MKPKINQLTLIMAALLCFHSQTYAQSDAQLFNDFFDSVACLSGKCPTSEIDAPITSDGSDVADTKDSAESGALKDAEYAACSSAKSAAVLKAKNTECENKEKCTFRIAFSKDECAYDKPTTISAEIRSRNSRGYRICLIALLGRGHEHKTARSHCDKLSLRRPRGWAAFSSVYRYRNSNAVLPKQTGSLSGEWRSVINCRTRALRN